MGTVTSFLTLSKTHSRLVTSCPTVWDGAAYGRSPSWVPLRPLFRRSVYLSATRFAVPTGSLENVPFPKTFNQSKDSWVTRGGRDLPVP